CQRRRRQHRCGLQGRLCRGADCAKPRPICDRPLDEVPDMRLYCAALLFIAVFAFTWAGAGQAKKGADKDFSAELPRIPPKEPADALKTIKVAPGFHVE